MSNNKSKRKNDADPSLNSEAAREERNGQPSSPFESSAPQCADPPLMVNIFPAACPRCGSTDRTNYSRVRTRAKGGKAPNGREYTHIAIKCTRCERCGRPRTERHFINATAGDPLPDDC